MHFGLEHYFVERWQAWARRSRKASAIAHEGQWLLTQNIRYRVAVVLFALAWSAACVGMLIDGHLFDQDPAWKRWMLEIGYVGFAVVFSLAAAFVCTERVLVSDLGVTQVTLFGTRKLPWPALDHVEALAHDEGIQLFGKNGQRVKVSADLNGLPVLYRFLQKHGSRQDVYVAWCQGFRDLAERR